MSSTPGDEMPSIGFLARYLADAAKQRLPARSVATVLQSYVDRGLPAGRIAQAVERARDGLAAALHPLLEEYASQLEGATKGTSSSTP
jgi:hypothetical protein